MFDLFIQRSCEEEEHRRLSTPEESLDMKTLLLPSVKSKSKQKKEERPKEKKTLIAFFIHFTLFYSALLDLSQEKFLFCVFK